MKRYVAIVGPADGATDNNRRDAMAAAEKLARADVVVLTGGHHGVMGAAAEGVAAGGGTSVGLLPGIDRREGHPALTLSLPTGLGELRNGLLVRSADVVLAIGGSWGTTSEIALAVRTGVPVVALAGWQLPAGPIEEATDVSDAVNRVLAALP